MVLSLLRDADCVKDRWELCPACICGCLRHFGAVRAGIEAMVRRAMRGTAVVSRALVAPMTSLHGADMIASDGVGV